MLEQLPGVEVEARGERFLSTRTKMAHFPFQRTLEQFDFPFQPSIDERQVKELASLAVVAEATNILLLDLPAWAKPTWRWHWPSGPSSMATGLTSSGPMT